jgi:arylsulfatase A-like enzyme
VLACLAAWAGTGCRPTGAGEPAFARPRYQMGGGARGGSRATATLADDTRPVLVAPTPALISFRQNLDLPTDGRIALDYQLPPSIRGSGRYRIDVTLEGPDHKEQLPPLVATPVLRGRVPRLALEADLPAPLAHAAWLRATVGATALELAPYARAESAAWEIPQNAWLEFAIGLAEADLGGPDIHFSVSACEAEDCETVFDEALDPSGAAARTWQDRRVDLARFGGKTRRFVFAASAPADALALPLWANPSVYAPAERRPEELNVILLSVDTLRADHLPSYGYARDTAPFIESRLAQRGTVFDAFIAAAAVTAPSHMTMFTGLQPSAHGTTDGLKRLPESIPTQPELIRAHGLETSAFTEDGWVSTHQGFSRGFDSFTENKSPDLMAPVGQVDVTFGQARRWLERHRNRRFFLFLHTYQVHSPYAPPERYADLFAPDPGADAALDETAQNAANYDREIRFTDDELRGLFGAIEELGLADRTVFVLASDHGEEFGDHGLISHGGHLYRESVRVPLIFEGPGIPAGRRIATPVAEVRLTPTILDLLHVQRPADLAPRSLLPLIEGGEEAASEPIFSEGLVPFQPTADGSLHPFRPPIFSVQLGTRKLIRERTDDGYRYEYYDLAADPHEQHDLYPTRAAEAADLAALIEAYPQERLREFSERTGKAPRPPGQRDLQLDPQHEEKLKALGYVE